MQKVKFRLGPADSRTTKRVVKYRYELNGETVAPDDVVVDSRAISIELEVPDGAMITALTFHDEDRKGNQGVARSPINKFVVDGERPLVSGSINYEGTEAVDDPSPGSQAIEAEPEGETPEVESEGSEDKEADPSRSVVVTNVPNTSGEPLLPKGTEVWIDEQFETPPIPDGEIDVSGTEELSKTQGSEESDISEADHIRAYLGEHPDASNKDVIAALAEKGVEVSSSQVSKIKKQLAK